jgi:hypothetical protein
MPIPPLRPDGTLPPGSYDASLSDIFVAYPAISPRRLLLNDELAKFVGLLQQQNLAYEMVVDGSYTTQKLQPDDVDVAIWLMKVVTPSIEDLFIQAGIDIDHLIHPWFEIDKIEYDKWVQFFSEKRDGTPKGIIRLIL